MANSVWFEIAGDSVQYPNVESVRTAALAAAKGTDTPVEVYRHTRTLVKTVQRQVTLSETDA